VAVGVLVCPQFFEDETIWLDVETGGELSMGRLVADRRTLRSELRTGVPVRCITGAKADRFVQLFLDRVLG
jgi:inosine-uridine nucleoside N-ribohydrolase